MAKGYSLHIGLNGVSPDHYADQWTGTLQAGENDARTMQKLATSLGYSTTMLLSKQATADAVIEAITATAAQMTPTDVFLLTYSGHGAQVPDYNHDEATATDSDVGAIKDKRDETWCLYDRQLIDDELWALWAEFPAKSRIVVLSDSCHSGSVTKDMDGLFNSSHHVADEPAEKRMPLKVEEATYHAHRRTYEGIQKAVPKKSANVVGASVMLVSGCMDNQKSLDGKVNSLFTRRLLQVWDKGAFVGSLRELRDETAAIMPADQQPNLYTVGAPSKRVQSAPALRI